MEERVRIFSLPIVLVFMREEMFLIEQIFHPQDYIALVEELAMSSEGSVMRCDRDAVFGYGIEIALHVV